jgi:diguanylate cyclase (GGDEF)-like protein
MQVCSTDTRVTRAICPIKDITASANLDSRLMKLMQRLQRTLDPAGLLEIFLEELDTKVGLHGIEFFAQTETMPSGESRFCIGSLVGDRVGVNLTAGIHSLGRLDLYCMKPPGATFVHVFEKFAACLAWPMYNALAYRRVRHLAHSDSLTGTGNRLAFDRALEREIARSKRHGSPLSILLVDLDDFKQINDSYGHVVGDRVLQQVADHMRDRLRQVDQLFRIGGDEFAILLIEADQAAATVASERLSSGLTSSDCRPLVTFSIGAAQWMPGMSADELQERADRALYRNKLRS